MNTQDFHHEKTVSVTGISLRDYFAAKALSGLLAGLDRDARRFMERQEEPAEAMAKACWVMADAMLKAREK